MLGHMQKINHFWAQIEKKNPKWQLGRFCPEPFNHVSALQLFDRLLQYTNQNCEEHKNYEIPVLVWIMSVFQISIS